MTLPVSVLILTKNETVDIAGCIASVAWSDDVHVLDSFSSDDTVQLAERAGAVVTARAFDGFSSQRNFGLKHIVYKHDWLLILDADERVPAELVAEMAAFIPQAPVDVAACRIRRRDYWWDRWLKHAQISPFFIRLVRPARVHYEREINEVLVVDGRTHELGSFFNHFPFSKGMDHWLSKHNQYSRMEAELIVGGGVMQPSWKTAFFGADFNERRVHQKAIFYRLPGRPFIKFCYMMLARRAFLDGWAGIRYTLLQCIYEYFIVLKTKELQQQRAPRPGQ
ncbi:glycosyltransferase family 2 protein [Janthinobacterium sp.]|uniref:glycosyltransferase family 2 protein n=1 Tax=Janthinobacterium sp. TaxID=1871054 RepID=UPI00293D91C6|nr:glycosyltransferase family 2 protein [Janthinobacterium sp.]